MTLRQFWLCSLLLGLCGCGPAQPPMACSYPMADCAGSGSYANDLSSDTSNCGRWGSICAGACVDGSCVARDAGGVAPDLSLGSRDGSVAAPDFGIDMATPDLSIPAKNFALGPSIPLHTDGQPARVAVCDLNGDKKPDLLVVGSTVMGFKGFVDVFLGHGDGTFEAPVGYPTGETSLGVAASDFNGDGRQDVAVSNQDSNNLSILLGNGDGTLKNAVNLPTHMPTEDVQTADINGDGKGDVIVAGGDANLGAVGVLIGKGDGTFLTQTTLVAHAGTNSVAIADFNGDKKLDIATANPGPARTYNIFRGNGDGTFQPPGVGALDDVFTVSAGDLNGDNAPDLLFAGGADVLVFNDGKGGFDAPMGLGFNNGGMPGVSTAIGDLDGDGIADFVYTLNSGFSICLGTGQGNFAKPIKFNGVDDGGGFGVAIADINGDGKLDVVVLDMGGNGVKVFLNETM